MDVLRHYGSAAARVVRRRRERRRPTASSGRPAPYKPEDLAAPDRADAEALRRGGQKLIDDVAGVVRRRQRVHRARSSTRADAGRVRGDRPAAAGRTPWTPDATSQRRLAHRRAARQRRRRRAVAGDAAHGRHAERFGRKRGLQVWQDLRSLDDPEAPVTATRKKGFPYGQIPKRPLGTAAIPDAGLAEVRLDARSASRTRRRRALGRASGAGQGAAALPAGGVQRAARVGEAARRPATRWPSSGSQAGYFEPEIWWASRRTARASTCAARTSRARARTSRSGAAATTRGARRRPARTSPTSTRWTCATPTAPRRRSTPCPTSTAASAWRWSRSSAPRAGPERRRHDGGRLRDVPRRCARRWDSSSARATIGGKPVVYTKLRATYMHELDSAPGFQEWNDPDRDHGRAGVPARGDEGRLHVQLALHRRPRHRLHQHGSNPVGRKAVNRPAADPVVAGDRVEGLRPRHEHRDATSRCPSARRRSTRTTW